MLFHRYSHLDARWCRSFTLVPCYVFPFTLRGFHLDNSTPEIVIETLDVVSTRLRGFAADLVSRLRDAHFTVETFPIWLLGDSNYPIEMPARINGVEISSEFVAREPRADVPRVRAGLVVRFDHGQQYTFYERVGGSGLPMNQVVNRYLDEVVKCEHKRRKQEEIQGKKKRAESRFFSLLQESGLVQDPHDPNSARKDNAHVRCLPDNPTQVMLTILVDHQQATEILGKYLKTEGKETP